MNDVTIVDANVELPSFLESTNGTVGIVYRPERIRRVYKTIPSTAGLEYLAQWRGYGSYHPEGTVDPWVDSTLRIFDPELRDRIQGFTRRGAGVPGAFSSLEKYSGHLSRFTDFTKTQRTAMIKAIGKARTAFKAPYKYQPLELKAVGQHMKTDTSAGFSFPRKLKKDVMADIYNKARSLKYTFGRNGKGLFNPSKARVAPCLAGTRGHISPEDKVKTRLVWVYPAEMLAIEGMFAPVLYDMIANMPDGPLLLGKGSHRLYSDWLSGWIDGENLHGLDFSAFDTQVPPWLIYTAFEILARNIDFEHVGTAEASQRQRQEMRNIWNAIQWYFINTPILMPDGRLFRKHHGVPSGSYFTQMIDSIVNYILIQYLCECQGLEPKQLKVLGDDSAFRSHHTLDLERAQRDADAVNMKLGVEKCELTKDPTEFKLLGLKYRDGHGYRPDDEWFKFALYPESIPPDISTAFSRLVGLWIGGAMYCRRFLEFMNFYQSSFSMPTEGFFSKEQRKWMEIVFGKKAPRGWSSKDSLFWRSIFYVL